MTPEHWVTIVPPAGRLKETAQELLRLARESAHVQTGGNGSEFLVPSYVADAYTEWMAVQAAPGPEPSDAARMKSDAPRRTRGRKRKEDQ